MMNMKTVLWPKNPIQKEQIVMGIQKVCCIFLVIHLLYGCVCVGACMCATFSCRLHWLISLLIWPNISSSSSTPSSVLLPLVYSVNSLRLPSKLSRLMFVNLSFTLHLISWSILVAFIIVLFWAQNCKCNEMLFMAHLWSSNCICSHCMLPSLVFPKGVFCLRSCLGI